MRLCPGATTTALKRKAGQFDSIGDMALAISIRCAQQVKILAPGLLPSARYATTTKAADSFMAELEASGFTPTDIKKICTKHPSMLSKHWTPAARKQKIELLKRIEEQEAAKALETKSENKASSV